MINGSHGPNIVNLDNPSTTMSWRTYRDWINSPNFCWIWPSIVPAL